MSDKRIIKTKNKLKNTLVELLDIVPFEKMTVSEICRKSGVSRITFYTYYDDKYSLIDELCSDYIVEANEDYHRMPDPSTKVACAEGYLKHVICIINLYFKNDAFFKHIYPNENPFLYSVFRDHIYDSVVDYLTRHRRLVSKYPTEIAASLICNGLFGVINTSLNLGMDEDGVRRLVCGMYEDILSSCFYCPAG